MKRTLIALATAATLVVATAAPSTPARADGGATAAWIIGGILVGGLIIAATHPQQAYATPYGYAAPYGYAPVRAAGPCYWTNQRVYGGWQRVRVCY